MTTSYKRMQHLFMNKVLLSQPARHFTWTCTHSADYTHLLSLTLIKSIAHIPQLLIPPVPDCSLPHRTIRWSLCLKPRNQTLYVPDLSVCPHIDNNLSWPVCLLPVSLLGWIVNLLSSFECFQKECQCSLFPTGCSATDFLINFFQFNKGLWILLCLWCWVWVQKTLVTVVMCK